MELDDILLGFCCSEKVRDQDQFEEQRIFFHLTVPYHGPSLRGSGQEPKQGRHLEVGADSQALEECCSLLAPHGLLSLLSHSPQPTPTDWAFPQQLLKKCSTGLSTA